MSAIIVSSRDKKSGCGLLNSFFGRQKFWPRRTTSKGSIRGQTGTVKSIHTFESAGHNSKSRRGNFHHLPAANLSSQTLYIPRGLKPQPKIRLAKEQLHHQIRHGVKQIHVQSRGQNTIKTVPKETLGISEELEMMIAEHQINKKGGANLVRVSSGNVMVYGNLGNLRQPESTTYANSKPTLNPRQEYKVGHSRVGNVVNKKPLPNGEKVIEGSSMSQCRALSCRMDPEKLKIMGNEDYKNGRFAEALSMYERASDLDQAQASYRSNKSVVLTALGRLLEAVFECRETINIDPHYPRVHHRLANLYLRIGEAEKAVYHLKQVGPEADLDTIRKAKAVLRHMKKCDDAKRLKDWHAVLRESGNAISAGADSAPMIIALQVEALLKLQRHEDADMTLTNGVKFDVDQCTRFFGSAGSATLLLIRAQVDIAIGRFDDAMEAVQQAGRLDPSNRDLSGITRRAKAVLAARSHGNELFKEGSFLEACVAYGHGLEHEPCNSILLCNRAACRTKLGQFEKAVEDCTSALKVRPTYSKARLRRADCFAKLQKWEAAVKDYEMVLQESLGDEVVGKALFEAQVKLKKQRREDVSNMVYGNAVKIESSKHFTNLTSWPGLSVALFHMKPADERMQQSIEQLSNRYPTLKFLNVQIDDKDNNKTLMKSESISISSLPVFKIYRRGLSIHTVSGQDGESLECSIKAYLS